MEKHIHQGGREKQAQTNFLHHTNLHEYAQEFPLQFEKFKEFAHNLERFLFLDFEYNDENSKKKVFKTMCGKSAGISAGEIR